MRLLLFLLICIFSLKSYADIYKCEILPSQFVYSAENTHDHCVQIEETASIYSPQSFQEKSYTDRKTVIRAEISQKEHQNELIRAYLRIHQSKDKPVGYSTLSHEKLLHTLRHNEKLLKKLQKDLAN